MTATRSTTPQTVYETPNDEGDQSDPSQESQLPDNSEAMNAEGVR
jgi:hypothetical protein